MRSQRHRRVVVAAGDVPAGINHHHQHGADASGARAAPLRTGAPTVKTKKNVPMNSTIIFRVVGWSLTAVGARFRDWEADGHGNAPYKTERLVSL